MWNLKLIKIMIDSPVLNQGPWLAYNTVLDNIGAWWHNYCGICEIWEYPCRSLLPIRVFDWMQVPDKEVILVLFIIVRAILDLQNSKTNTKKVNIGVRKLLLFIWCWKRYMVMRETKSKCHNPINCLQNFPVFVSI